MGIKAGINIYQYASSNPIMFVDPKGLEVSYCDGPLRTYDHAVVCLNGKCAGLMPLEVSFFYGEGIIQEDDMDDFQPGDCINKDVEGEPCCDQNKYEKCIQKEAIDKIDTPHKYGLLTFNCRHWARSIIIKCQKEACQQ